MKKLLTLIIVVAVCASCSNYYKAVTTTEPANGDNMNKMKLKERYFILRNGSEAYAIKNISFSGDQKNMACTLENLPAEHKLHLTNGRGGQMRYRKTTTTDEDETPVLNEVHIYINPDANIVPGAYTLALDKVQKTEIIEEDKAKTKRSHVTGVVVGSSAAVLAAAGIVAIAIASVTFSIF